MKLMTAREARREHSKTFFDQRTVTDCDLWMAGDAQLAAYFRRQNGDVSGLAEADDYYARQIMGITEGDQFYA